MHMDDLPFEALPWSQEAETSLLGALMIDNAGWDQVGDIVTTEQFFDGRHGVIFVAIRGLVLASKPADVITVWSSLENSGQAGSIDIQYLNKLSQSVISARNIRQYAEIVAERALMRGLMAAADEVRALAVAPGLPVAERLELAQAKLQALQINRGRQMPVAVYDLATGMLDRIQDLYDGTTVPGISTGIPALDKRLSGGLRPGKQMVLAARPSVGKSSLALQICLNLARAGHGAAFFSMEMPNDEQMDRATANVGRILLDNILTGQLQGAEWNFLSVAVEEIRKLPLFFDEQPALTLGDIAAKARALVRTHKIKLLVIDYIQLCGSSGGNEKRHHQIETISRGLKTLAKQLGITIITLSQLGRGAETRANAKPQLSDLKESGAIEEDADIVIFLSLNHIPQHGPKIIEADFAKNRQGRIGSVPLTFDGGYQRWAEGHPDSLVRKAATGMRYTEEA